MEEGILFTLRGSKAKNKTIYRVRKSDGRCGNCAGGKSTSLCKRLPFCLKTSISPNWQFIKLSSREMRFAIKNKLTIHEF